LGRWTAEDLYTANSAAANVFKSASGLVNEPGFRSANKPDEFGLWLYEEAEPEPAGIDRTVYGSFGRARFSAFFSESVFQRGTRKEWNAIVS